MSAPPRQPPAGPDKGYEVEIEPGMLGWGFVVRYGGGFVGQGGCHPTRASAQRAARRCLAAHEAAQPERKPAAGGPQ